MAFIEFCLKIEISEKLIELNTSLKNTVDNFIKNPKTPKPSKLKENNLKETKKEIKAQRYVLLNKKRGVDELDKNTIGKITSKEVSLDKTEQAINDYGDMNILDVELDIGVETDLNAEKNSSDRISCNGFELIREKVNFSFDIFTKKA